MLENLYRAQCVGADAGLGAMIIAPTRELAIQIFDVLYKIGKHGHLFAAGLVIGGKSLMEEQDALARMNIVVCTPGRILQHLSQTAAFNVDNLKMLVLDEADRIMDMGFQRDVDAIIEYLPSQRQTFLFSATQTKKVSDLARLSLNNPEYVSVHASADAATPTTLQQNYIVVPLPSKLDTLWSFIQSSKKTKILVFLSSGKQVRFVYEAFCKMQPGMPLLHIHGRQKQTPRLDIIRRFSAAQHTCLFATDLAARGLDFPAVDWVVQVDCPEDADTYIHRVGRTARYEREGRAILFLDPSEEAGMLERLAKKRVPIERINIRAKKQTSIKNKMQGICFKHPELKYLGQKAFVSYTRSLHVQKDKEIFRISDYQLEEFAASLGLPGAPRIRFTKGDAEAAKMLKNAPKQDLEDLDSDVDIEEHADGMREEFRDRNTQKMNTKKDAVRTKYDRMFERRNQDILAPHHTAMIDEDIARYGDEVLNTTCNAIEAPGIANNEDDLFIVKRHIVPSSEVLPAADRIESVRPLASLTDTRSNGHIPLIVDSNRRLRALKSKKKTAKLINATSTKLVFDDVTGEARPAHVFDDETAIGDRDRARRDFVDKEAQTMAIRDVDDKDFAREKNRRKREKAKERIRREVVSEAEDDSTALESVERPFEELADLYAMEDDAVNQSGETLRKNERPKKWFEDDDDDGDEEWNRNMKKIRSANMEKAEPETFEDLEKLAAGLLG